MFLDLCAGSLPVFSIRYFASHFYNHCLPPPKWGIVGIKTCPGISSTLWEHADDYSSVTTTANFNGVTNQIFYNPALSLYSGGYQKIIALHLALLSPTNN